ncbi:placenta-specific gene 8 protein-like [Notolabrus celidotus]|uniref:placenta-specific gene 8 protein-like n=1 Tax=Notolabrus celidotus TaxID=1203425 RepID=UPI00148F844C|nr:placenta-specific gene 8 protein-like [Notolabrus celidotus]XP_034558667.1 placenta-specific gene 8 protein-like [Notolabrus celidotus]
MENKPLVDWDSGLMDCFEEPSTCCYGFWCGPCLACTVSGRFGENTFLPLFDFCGVTTFCGIPMCVPPAGLSMRAAMRNRYGIKGSLCKDIVAACCCGWCSWCQMHRELKHRKKTPTVINVQNQTIFATQPAPMMMMMPPAVMNQQGVVTISH